MFILWGYLHILLLHAFGFPGVHNRVNTLHCPCIGFSGLFCRGSCCFLLSSVHYIVFCLVWSCIQVCLFAALFCFPSSAWFLFLYLPPLLFLGWWFPSWGFPWPCSGHVCLCVAFPLLGCILPGFLWLQPSTGCFCCCHWLVEWWAFLWSILWACITLFFFDHPFYGEVPCFLKEDTGGGLLG